MSHAQELITAIQTCNPGRLRAVIERLNLLADDEVKHLAGTEKAWARKNYINDRLPGGLDITALHLAAKAYSAHASDKTLGPVFNEMVSDLLAAGAMPWLEVGSKPVKEKVGATTKIRMTMGQTVLEVCEGKMPPALTEWVAANCDDNATIKGFCATKHEATTKHRDKKISAWRERKRIRDGVEQEDIGPMADHHLENQPTAAMG